MSDMQEKVEDYVGMGVGMVWVVDPRRRKAFETEGVSLQPVYHLTVPATAIQFAVSDVFAGIEGFEA